MITIKAGQVLDEWVDFGGKRKRFRIVCPPVSPTIYVDGKPNNGEPFGPIRERHHLTTKAPALRDITLTVEEVP